MPEIKDARKAVQQHLKDLFKARGQQLSEVGSGTAIPEVDPKTGSWLESGQASKTPRYLLQFRVVSGQLEVGDFYKNATTGKIGHTNTNSFGRKGIPGLVLRTTPVFLQPDSTFEVNPDWEWITVVLFGKAIVNGSSSETISNFIPPTPSISCKGKTVPISGVYLFGLLPPTSTYIYAKGVAGEEKTITYGEATDALQKYLTFNF